jgi:putative addiction module killer protein
MYTEVSPKSLKLFRLQTGSMPFVKWFSELRDIKAKQKIIARLARVRTGNLGQTQAVGEGVQELKIDYGRGDRVYFGQAGNEIIILLCGGDKRAQNEDIKRAKAYWAEYKKEKSHAGC